MTGQTAAFQFDRVADQLPLDKERAEDCQHDIKQLLELFRVPTCRPALRQPDFLTGNAVPRCAQMLIGSEQMRKLVGKYWHILRFPLAPEAISAGKDPHGLGQARVHSTRRDDSYKTREAKSWQARIGCARESPGCCPGNPHRRGVDSGGAALRLRQRPVHTKTAASGRCGGPNALQWLEKRRRTYPVQRPKERCPGNQCRRLRECRDRNRLIR